MPDVMTAGQRSRNMSRIRGKNTKPEMTLRKALWALGLRYQIHYKIPGKPDIVFVSAKLAVFVDGCFWHGCPEHAVSPKGNSDFWAKKLDKNKLRDQMVNSELDKNNWRLIRVWEHEIEQYLPNVVARIYNEVTHK